MCFGCSFFNTVDLHHGFTTKEAMVGVVNTFSSILVDSIGNMLDADLLLYSEYYQRLYTIQRYGCKGMNVHFGRINNL